MNNPNLVDSETDLGAAIENAPLDDDRDPRSLFYVRKLNRPAINWLKAGIFALLPIIFTAAFLILLHHYNIDSFWAILSVVIILSVYIAFMLKPATVFCVRVYQRYAPDRIRNKCRFEPSCSEYMILAIEKYGLIRGLRKGIDRLKRCNVDHGGFDEP